MVTSTAGKPSVGTAARFAYAAGFTGILANLFSSPCMSCLACRPEAPRLRPPRSAQPANCRARPAIWWDRSRPRS
jgi:hypothetical protein